MGGCTSKRAAAVKAQQQSNGKSAASAKPAAKKKKKKGKAKIYSAFASMESLSNEIPADRACNVPQARKTPYSRVANAASMQLTAFGFRRRGLPNPAPAPAPNMPNSTSSYHCSPHHVPPTPPTEPKPKPATGNRFGFQLSPRATAVLNNINAQIVSNNSNNSNNSNMDGNCNPVPETTSYETSPLEENNRSTLAVTASNPPPAAKPTQSLLPKPKENKSRLPSPKSATTSKSKPQTGLKQPSAGKNGANIAKPVVAKPVSRPPSTKSAKTEANRIMANQSADSSPGSGKSASSGIGTLSATDDSPSDLRERFELVRAPTAISEDLDEEEREEKACIDENSSEKMPPPFPIPVWTETAADEVSSNGSYSEGIEEQQIEFPDNVTDKSGDSLISSISSTSSEPNGKLKTKKKSGSSLSQLSNGSDDNFLIDDEIADQPGLTFDDNNYDDTEYIVNEDDIVDGEEEETEAQYNKDDTTFMGDITLNGEEQTYNIEETVTNEETPPQDLSTLVQDLPPSIQVGDEEGGREAQASPVRTFNSTPRRLRSNSTGTLSPCESITSDDLMLDLDDESVASRNVSITRLAELGSGISGSEEIINKWNVMLGSVTSLNSLGCGGQTAGTQQTPPSLRSRASSNSEVGRSYNSPLRPPRSSVGSFDSDWTANQNILQDILTLKTGLLKLKRTLQDADVRNPFDSSLSLSGMYYNLANSDGFEKEEHVNVSVDEENVDLRRQVIFLKQQLSEKDRTITLLQQQMVKYCGVDESGEDASEKSSVATQTERNRPVSMGSTMSHSAPSDGSGPLVSTSTENLRQHNARGCASDGPKLQKPVFALNNNNSSSKSASYEMLRTSSSSIPIPKSIPTRKNHL